jgi:hypothetical protein
MFAPRYFNRAYFAVRYFPPIVAEILTRICTLNVSVGISSISVSMNTGSLHTEMNTGNLNTMVRCP